MKDKVITSISNPRIKSLVKLRQHSFRQEQGLIFIEGLREVELANKSNIGIKEIFYCEDFLSDINILENLSSEAAKIFKVSSAVFSKIAFGNRKEGILAVAEQPQKDLGDLELSKQSILVIVEQVEKPGNLGAIMRTCDAAGVTGLILCDCKTDAYNPNVIRASLGACFSLKLVEAGRPDTIAWLKSEKISVISAVPDVKNSLWQTQFGSPCAIVFGSEDKGVSQAFIDISESKVSIPMQGRVDSLNVSTSAAIILYEVLRQKNSNP